MDTEMQRRRQDARQFAQENTDFLKRTLEELSQIPAPSRREEKRREYCREWLRKFEIDAQSDGKGNLVVPYRLKEGKQNIVIAAHMDIVFEESVPLQIKKEGQIWRCPGIGDNTANVVLLLFAAKFLKEYDPDLDYGILLAFDTCEEGLGNLEGCRAVMDRYRDCVSRVIAFDLYRDQVYAECIGSLRYEITVRTPGGHSFADFGKTNAVWVMAKLIGQLYQYQAQGCTTYNVGVIQGGTSVNTIAQEARILFEYRSDRAQELEKCRAYLQECLREIGKIKDVSAACRMVGERPCMQNADREEIGILTQICQEEIERISGVCPKKAKASTDCNIPLSLGIPAVCTGFFRGGGAHTLEEWIDIGTAESALETAVSVLCGIAGRKKIDRKKTP